MYAVSPLSADTRDPEQMQKMAEFICRANYGMIRGNFEMDFHDGEVRFKYYVDCRESMPSKEMIGDSILFSVSVVSRYGEGILQILFNNMSAEDAIKLCEGD